MLSSRLIVAARRWCAPWTAQYGERRLDGDLGGLEVADLADHDVRSWRRRSAAAS
jgi:hypothetical protein